MSKRDWTNPQRAAIESLDGSVIVSAAAGSGKTAVLIERILNRISNEAKPCPVDSLLVVTFTNAAANEMRERLNSALSEKIKENPTNRYLKRQQLMLPMAQICTMDQFFNNLVRDNFHSLGITPDYRILDNGEASLLSAEAMDEVLEELYEQGSEEFSNLLTLFGCEKYDGPLAEGIEKLNLYSSSYANPEKWLDSIVKSYSGTDKPQDTRFGKVLLDNICENCRYALETISKAKALVKELTEFDKIHILLCNDENTVNAVLSLALSGTWDKLKLSLENMTFDRFPSYRGDNKDCYEKVFSQKLCNKARAVMKDLKGVIPASESEYRDDVEKLNPIVKKLIEATKKYNERLSEKKKEQNSMDFSDIEHLALKLLLTDNNEPTKLALELRESYNEILIDEYQDTNEAQDTVFCTLSKNKGNMFLVGDVKQSIYRFRLAMPQIFISRSLEWQQADKEYPKAINLDTNFRSRKGVLESVNFLFSKIMSGQIGDVTYDESVSLKYGAEYQPVAQPETELCILEKANLDGYGESDYIADRIKSMISDGMTISDKGVLRKVGYRDICILTRRKKPAAEIFNTLKANDIPAFFEDDSGFFDNTEVSVMLSFLSIIDNPLQDIPLLAVMMSPLFGFSADNVSSIRVNCRNMKLYYAVRQSQLPVAVDFIKCYDEYRRLSTVMSVSSLIRTIYENSGYLSVVSALENGENRKLNLLLLVEYATDYESYGSNSLSGFIRFIEKIKESDGDLKPASSVSEYADVVRIMTVHKSKGLEFPVVFIADCGNKTYSHPSNLILHEQTGIGLKVIDKQSFRKYNTVQFNAANVLRKISDCSEEIRVLYVAMTRAREKLVLVGTTSKTAGDIAFDCAINATDKMMNPVAVMRTSSFLELFVSGYLRHPSAAVLRDLAGCRCSVDSKGISPIVFNIVSKPFYEEKETDETETDEKSYGNIDNREIKRLIDEKTAYEYPYMKLRSSPTKMAASAFNRIENDDSFFACDKPHFASDDGLTGAGRGTAMHKFLEVCDFESAKADIRHEIDRLLSENALSQQQAEVLDIHALNTFFNSELYSRMKASQRLMREQKFTISVPVTTAFDELGQEFDSEEILVQGVIDCAFVENGSIIIADYKTDRVQNYEELIRRYHRQVEIYKTAAEQVFNMPVSQILLYSFSLNAQTEI